MLICPAGHVCDIHNFGIRDGERLGVQLHELRVFFGSRLLRFPVAFQQARAEFFVQRRRNGHPDCRIDEMFRLGFACRLASGILRVERVLEAVLDTSLASLSLLGARDPDTGIDRHPERLCKGLRFQRSLRDAFKSIERLGVAVLAFHKQVSNHFRAGIHCLRIRAHLGAVAIRELGRAQVKGLVRHRLEYFFVNLDRIFGRKLTAVDFFGSALLHDFLCSRDIARIDCLAEFRLCKRRCRQAKRNRANYGKNLS